MGFLEGYIEQIGKICRLSAIHKHQKKLDIKINDCRVDKNNMEDIEIAIDSIGISIYNNTQQRK